VRPALTTSVAGENTLTRRVLAVVEPPGPNTTWPWYPTRSPRLPNNDAVDGEGPVDVGRHRNMFALCTAPATTLRVPLVGREGHLAALSPPATDPSRPVPPLVLEFSPVISTSCQGRCEHGSDCFWDSPCVCHPSDRDVRVAAHEVSAPLAPHRAVHAIFRPPTSSLAMLALATSQRQT